MEVRVRIDVSFAVLTVSDELFNGNSALEINDGHVTLYSGFIQSGCCCLSASLARLVPRRGADRVALRRADDGMESVQRWAGNERGLIGDPQMLDAVKGIREDDSLKEVSVAYHSSTPRAEHTLFPKRT